MVTALAVGLCANMIARSDAFQAGLDFSARSILRLGVALLGASITLQQIASLGIGVAGLVVLSVICTIACGVATARILKVDLSSGAIYGGAVAICGASAAMAISAALPDTERNRATTALAVIGVTILSTIAMMAYPVIATAIGMSDHAAGVFFGAAIHDVAQVVGAGYMVSETAGDTATIVKLMRVACLVPVVAVVAWLASRRLSSKGDDGISLAKPSLLPWFLFAFLAFSAGASSGAVAEPVLEGISGAAKVMLVTAIAALGCKTSFSALLQIGAKPIAMLTVPTLGLMVGVLLCLTYFQRGF